VKQSPLSYHPAYPCWSRPRVGDTRVAQGPEIRLVSRLFEEICHPFYPISLFSRTRRSSFLNTLTSLCSFRERAHPPRRGSLSFFQPSVLFTFFSGDPLTGLFRQSGRHRPTNVSATISPIRKPFACGDLPPLDSSFFLGRVLSKRFFSAL